MKNKKIVLILGTLIGLALLLLILEKTNIINLYQISPNSSQDSAAQGPTEEQKQQETEVNSDTKKQFLEDQTKPSNVDPATNTPTRSIDLSAKQEANNTVTAFTKLYGFGGGTCELTTTNGSKTNTQTAAIMYQPEFSSCAGFSVPIGTLGKGTWTLKLAVTSKDTTEIKTISYEVQ